MTAERVIVIALYAAIFASVLTVGFKAHLAEPFFLLRRPGLLIRSFLAMYVTVPALTVLVLWFVPVPVGVKVGLGLLAISAAMSTTPTQMMALGASPPYAFSLVIGMSLLAVITIPLSLAILTALPLAADGHVPPLELVKVVAINFLVPLAAGGLFQRMAPRLADRIAEPLSAVAGYLLLASLAGLLVLNFSGVRGMGVASFLVTAGLTVMALAIGHLLGGPAFGDRAALAIAASSRHTAVAALIATLNSLGSQTVAIIVVYKIASMLATIPYTKWCQKQLAVRSGKPSEAQRTSPARELAR